MNSQRQAVIFNILQALPGPAWTEASELMYAMVLGPLPDETADRLIREIVYRSKFRPTPSEMHQLYLDITTDIPGPDEAWAMVPKSEAETVVWTEEMREAYAMAAPLLEAGDFVAARMAFIESYKRLIERLRASTSKPRWSISLGTDKAGRTAVLADSLVRGRISARWIEQTFPDIYQEDDVQNLLPPDQRLAIEAERGNIKADLREMAARVGKQIGKE